MQRLMLFAVLLLLTSFQNASQTASWLFVMLRPIPACEGKCNNYELKEYPQKNEAGCRAQMDSCKAQYGDKPAYFTVAPGEAVIYYKYNKFVSNCDCKILGVHKSVSVAQAKAEMEQKVAEERVKKPKAFHNYEVYGWWPK